MTTGRLILASTHIGNPQDIPVRALEALRSADLTVFESESQARQFLKAAGITRTYMYYSEHDESSTREAVREGLKKGSTITYMSDQGSPGLEDPGHRMAAMAYELGATVSVIPGPSAVTAAISACPFAVRQFVYAGLPPREPEARVTFLKAAVRYNSTVVLMDTPYRLAALSQDLGRLDDVDRKRPLLLALDMSGEGERYWSGTVGRVGEFVATLGETRINFVMVIGPGFDEMRANRRPQTRAPKFIKKKKPRRPLEIRPPARRK